MDLKIFRQIKDLILDMVLPLPAIEVETEDAVEVILEEKMDLEPVKELFEEYIGVIIVGFENYRKDILNFGPNIQTKFIAQVKIVEDDLILKLSSVNGVDAGYLKISPTIDGEFASFDTLDQKIDDAVYRIVFVGENVIEYSDFDSNGAIGYYSRL